jgi:YD repeat-containing protein
MTSGNVTSTTNPDNTVVHAEYDNNGNVTKITPPGKGDHSFTWGPQGNISSYTSPGNAAENTASRYNLTNDLELSTVNDTDGTEVHFDYDSAGRIIATTSPAGATTFNYDTNGRFRRCDRHQTYHRIRL